MTEETIKEKKLVSAKNWLKRSPQRWVLGAVLLLGLALAGYAAFNVDNGETGNGEKTVKEVKTVVLELNGKKALRIEAVGEAKPQTSVDVVALAKGTVRRVLFSIGDQVFPGKTLVSLSDTLVLTALINAETNYSNSMNSYLAAQRLTQETVRQAGLAVDAAASGVEAAEIGLKTAQDNRANYLNINDKTNEDARKRAVVAFGSYLNTIFSALDQADQIIKAEDSAKSGAGLLVDPGLSAKNPAYLAQARGSYNIAKSAYDMLKDRAVTEATVTVETSEVVLALAQTKITVDNVISVLDNSVSNTNLTEAYLAGQKTAFIALRSGVVGAQQGAEAGLQSLQNQGIVSAGDLANLDNAVAAAENRLSQAQVGVLNARQALEGAKQGAQSQVLGAKSALDGAKSQLNLARVQAGDLTISAPIAGTITAKNIEIGREVSPGLKVAEVSQAGMLKIEIDLTTDEAARLTLGQEAFIQGQEGELEARVYKIYPAADPVSRKVKVEILFDNKDKALVPGSFATVALPIAKANGKSLFVPLKAVTITPSESFVWLNQDGKSEKRTIEAGISDGDQIEVITGLADGDELIVEGGKFLEADEEIKVVE